MKKGPKENLCNAFTPLDVSDVQHMTLRREEIVARAEDRSLLLTPDNHSVRYRTKDTSI